MPKPAVEPTYQLPHPSECPLLAGKTDDATIVWRRNNHLPLADELRTKVAFIIKKNETTHRNYATWAAKSIF